MEGKNFLSEGYEKYWRKVVEGSREGDFSPPKADIMNLYIAALGIKSGDKVLDAGCGYGREIPLLAKRGARVYGIDMLKSMVEEARKSFGNIAEEIVVQDIEAIFYPDNTFDKVFCWVTFDCLCQEKALAEMIRVAKIGGKILITGKNYAYFDDDKVAFMAEQKALENNFPNHFTYVYRLIKLLPQLGLKLDLGRGFKYRGDFGLNKFEDLKHYQDKFYEYVLILEKTEDKNIKEDLDICSEFSKNYIKKNKI